MTGPSLRQRLFDAAAVLSLLLCLIFAALWARSLGHFEMVTWRYARWLQANEVHCYSGFLAWYSNTLRLEVTIQPLRPAYFQGQSEDNIRTLHKLHPSGLQWAIIGEDRTLEMNVYPDGFSARHHSNKTGGVSGDHYVLAVRPWLPTLLAAVLPLAWLILYRRRNRTGWRFSLRDLFIAITILAILLAGGLWLMH